MRKGIICALLFTAVIFSGCAGPVSPPVPVTSSVPLAEYHRSGGIAGIFESLSIYENGTVISSKIRNGSITLNQSEISEIDDLLKQAPVISQNETTTYPKGGADMMYISVKYRGNKVKAPDQVYGKLVEILNRVPDT
jgi:hypothetical protein